MKSRENLVRLKQFQVNEKRRQLEQLDTMIQEFDRKAAELESQIKYEEQKSGISDVNHFAYSTFAKAARTRCDNLLASREELATQRETAVTALELAQSELDKAEMLEDRDSKSRAETGSRAMIG